MKTVLLLASVDEHQQPLHPGNTTRSEFIGVESLLYTLPKEILYYIVTKATEEDTTTKQMVHYKGRKSLFIQASG